MSNQTESQIHSSHSRLLHCTLQNGRRSRSTCARIQLELALLNTILSLPGKSQIENRFFSPFYKIKLFFPINLVTMIFYQAAKFNIDRSSMYLMRVSLAWIVYCLVYNHTFPILSSFVIIKYACPKACAKKSSCSIPLQCLV